MYFDQTKYFTVFRESQKTSVMTESVLLYSLGLI